VGSFRQPSISAHVEQYWFSKNRVVKDISENIVSGKVGFLRLIRVAQEILLSYSSASEKSKESIKTNGLVKPFHCRHQAPRFPDPYQ